MIVRTQIEGIKGERLALLFNNTVGGDTIQVYINSLLHMVQGVMNADAGTVDSCKNDIYYTIELVRAMQATLNTQTDLGGKPNIKQAETGCKIFGNKMDLEDI